jgi:hypothetical protein
MPNSLLGPNALTAPGTYTRAMAPAASDATPARNDYWGPSAHAKPKRTSWLRRLFARFNESDDADASNAPSSYRDYASGRNLPISRPWLDKKQ